MTRTPLVTVYITTKDRHTLCNRAIQSVANQTISDQTECIVIDDGSDLPFQLSNPDISKYFHSFHLIRNSSSIGASGARNIAIKKATGKYITGCDDDDEFTPARLSRFVSYWNNERSSGTGMLHSDAVKKTSDRYIQLKHPKQVVLADITKRNCIGNQIFTLTSMLQKTPFDSNLRVWEDWHLWIELINAYGKSENVQLATYIIDESHSEPRITTHSSQSNVNHTLVFLSSSCLGSRSYSYLYHFIASLAYFSFKQSPGQPILPIISIFIRTNKIEYIAKCLLLLVIKRLRTWFL